MESPIIIGFIGDGQLARMSAHQAIKLGFVCHFFGNSANGPCAGLGVFFKGKLNDFDLLKTFVHSCDVVTLENEFISTDFLLKLTKETNTPIYPSAHSFAMIDNKFIEKETFRLGGIPVCDYAIVKDKTTLSKFMHNKSFPVMIKAAKGGYDGYGNKKCNNLEQALDAIKFFARSEDDLVIAEQMVPFLKEVAITIVRSINGDVLAYPIVDTIQENNICHYVLAPADINNDIEEKIKNYAIKAMQIMDAVGVFSFEFFVLENGIVLLNESAPRPHNSAHYTMDGCQSSQFENHIRAITGLTLGSSHLKTKTTVMVNLLGTDNRETKVEQIDDYLNKANVHLHMYGKELSKPGRKMGHINITGANAKELLTMAKEISQRVRI